MSAEAPGMFTQLRRSGLVLAAFAMAGAVLLATLNEATEDRRDANREAAVVRQLTELVPADQFNNNPITDSVLLNDPRLSRSGPVRVFRARNNEEPVAALYESVAPDGYNGDIELLIGIHADGKLAGVRAIAHKETPGLGDGIDARRSDWILGFAGRSLRNPVLDDWQVKRDGGVFDQFSGATVTPRAVVKAVRQTLLYHRDQQAQVFAKETP